MTENNRKRKKDKKYVVADTDLLGSQGNHSFVVTCSYSPAHVVQWSNYLGAMCSRA